ncbi:hypothetical protein DFJ58DRAFT_797178 [Suillus subalutaceus]|uniref:uncharacterized protein n=1 Tax=Suillus subalutaceus TaxID=48586 RepID=UPI001B8625AD|nr:uncharacterized protein DFJ58DRAFT_797178 [Suillus subalutaceus]KAG1847871.1 hypothetical protein DFJ58DRAFT_797178 [Suillus subalutaceus]
MMHFAALVVLAVSASAVPGLAATLLPQSSYVNVFLRQPPNRPTEYIPSHLQANPKRDPMWALTANHYSTNVLTALSITRPRHLSHQCSMLTARHLRATPSSLSTPNRSLGKAADSATTKRDTDDSIQRSPPVRVWPYFDDVYPASAACYV